MLTISKTTQNGKILILPRWDKKRNYKLNLLSPTDHVKEKDIRDLLNQLSPTIILMGDFNAHKTLYVIKKNRHRRGNSRTTNI